MKPKVLAVDDDRECQEMWHRQLGEKVEVISALRVQEAKDRFDENPNVAVIIMDGKMDRDTTALVKELRVRYSGPIIAVSGGALMQEALLEAGCSHRADKMNVAEVIFKILGL